MVNLPDVTLCCITTRDYGESIQAITKTLEKITPAKTIFFTDISIEVPGAEVIQVEIKSWKQYNQWIIKELYKYIPTSHVLLIQHDGYVLDDKVWIDEFLQYDFIGAKWLYSDGRNVGNGGFSLRSKRLMTIMALDPTIEINCPEDEVICRLYRTYLEQKCEVIFAPEEMADKFSFELNPPYAPTFGFHGYHHQPYKKHILLRREGAAGDLIMLEPVMQNFYEKGYVVVLDTLPRIYNYFTNHYFPVRHISQIDKRIQYECVINFGMAYEIQPKRKVLESYYNIAGIDDGEIRNSRLSFKNKPENKLFKKYCIIHIDTTGIAHRDVHGIRWKEVSDYLESEGYTVIQVGIGKHEICGIEMKTPTESMIMWVVGGADLFIGIDSGIAQVAVALGIPSMIFFGSVNPTYRYNDFSKIYAIQNPCPIKKDGCYHSVISVKGTDCEVNKKQPPCITHETKSVINKIEHFIKNSFEGFINWKIFDSNYEQALNTKIYESKKRFLGISEGRWKHKGEGKFYHEKNEKAFVTEDIILKRPDIFTLVEN